MNVLFVGAEIFPFSKVGGLADVMGALSKALTELGISVKIITPGYGIIDRSKFELEKTEYRFFVNIGGNKERCTVEKWSSCETNGLDVFFIGNENLFSNRGIYSDSKGNPYSDNPLRFLFFQKAALKLASLLDWKPDIIHCHDNHSALIPVYLKSKSKYYPELASTKTVLTIHNLAYQGIMPMSLKSTIELPEEMFLPGGDLEHNGYINPLKAGIIYADEVNTVSGIYAKEIVGNQEYACGLQGVLTNRKKPVIGILNGVDYSEWNPELDRQIFCNYSVNNLAGKYRNKKKLIERIGWSEEMIEKPMLGMVSRLVGQKGIDLVICTIEEIIGRGANLVILGMGDEKYQHSLKKSAEQYPGRIFFSCGFDESLAHQIIAGSDIFLMPSHFEPCGVTQMYSLKYGTVPVVRATGGLADTVFQWDGKSGNGFIFSEYTCEAFLKSLKEAIQFFKNREVWGKIMRTAMAMDFSWENSAKEYIEMYKNMLSS